jgi:hypothetical protein
MCSGTMFIYCSFYRFMVIAKDKSGNVVKFAPKIEEGGSKTNANGKKRKLIEKRSSKPKRRSSEGTTAPSMLFSFFIMVLVHFD